MLPPDDYTAALIERTERRYHRQPSWRPGTVVRSTRNGLAMIQMDGDINGEAVEMQVLIGEVAAGDRVMVVFDPPHGAYVAGRISRPRLDAAGYRCCPSESET